MVEEDTWYLPLASTWICMCMCIYTTWTYTTHRDTMCNVPPFYILPQSTGFCEKKVQCDSHCALQDLVSEKLAMVTAYHWAASPTQQWWGRRGQTAAGSVSDLGKILFWRQRFKRKTPNMADTEENSESSAPPTRPPSAKFNWYFWKLLEPGLGTRAKLAFRSSFHRTIPGDFWNWAHWV